jgi:hypothetical protein
MSYADEEMLKYFSWVFCLFFGDLGDIDLATVGYLF